MPIGNTPLECLPTFYPGIGTGRWFAKLEGHNATGSMKIRSAHKILTEAQLAPGTKIIESTSGNMGVALATVAKALDLQSILVTDPKLSAFHRTHMEELGAHLECVTEQDETGGWLLTRLERVHSLLKNRPHWFWPNQYANPLNPLAFESIAIEVIRDLKKTEITLQDDTTLWFFAAVSTGGSLSGVARALRRLCHPENGTYCMRQLKIVAVDAEGSAIFGRPACRRFLNGIGSSLRRPPNLQRSLIDDVVIVTDEEAFRACHLLRREFPWGLVGGSSGAVYAALIQRAAHFKPNDIIVALFPDSGHMYEDTIYNATWLVDQGFPEYAT